MSEARTNPESTDSKPEPYLGKSDKALAIPLHVIPKSQWGSRAERIVSNILDNVDCLTAFVVIRQLKEISEVVLKQLEPMVVDKVAKEVEVAGAKIAIRNKAKVYEYTSTRLEQMESEVELKKGEIKNYKAWMENIEHPMPDPNTGELIEPAKLIEAGCTVAVTFPK